jgi:hypothetical protein
VFVGMLTPPTYLTPPLVYPGIRVCRDAYSSYESDLTSCISRGPCLLYYQINISYRFYEVGYCSLFTLFIDGYKNLPNVSKLHAVLNDKNFESMNARLHVITCMGNLFTMSCVYKIPYLCT